MLLPYCHLKITNRKYIGVQIRAIYSNTLGSNGDLVNVCLLRRLPTLSEGFLDALTS